MSQAQISADEASSSTNKWCGSKKSLSWTVPQLMHRRQISGKYRRFNLLDKKEEKSRKGSKKGQETGNISVVVVVVVLTLPRIIKSVDTGQAPVTLELRITLGEKHKANVVHA